MIIWQFCLSLCFYSLVSGRNFFMNFSVELPKFNNFQKVGASETKEVAALHKYNKPVTDSFEKKEDKKQPKAGFWDKWGKTVASVGAGAVAVTVSIVGLKKLNIAKARKIQEQVRKTAQEQAERANAERLRKAEEESKLAAEKIKKQLEEKARLKAELEAKIKAEKEAEALRLAKIAEENAYKEKVKNISDSFFQKFSTGRTVQVDRDFYDLYSKYTADEFLQGIIETVKEAEKQGLKEPDIKSFYAQIKESTKCTRFEYKDDLERSWFDFNLSKAAQRRNDIINDIENLEQSVARKNEETFGDYLARLVDIRKSKMPKESPVERVGAKLKYDDSTLEPVELTSDELKRLSEWRPEVFKGLSKDEALSKLQDYTSGWTRAHTDDMRDTSAYLPIEDILLKKGFSRYDSSSYRYRSNDYEVEPLYRWMNIQKGNYKVKPDGSVDYNSKIESVDSFVDEYFKVGDEYVAPWIQSCSKNKAWAETYFHDNNAGMTVKLVIHPKGKVSKAADLGWGKYGDNEAIYPQGSRFKVIDRHLEECVNTNYVAGSICDSNRVFSRWIVDLQEL